MKSFSIIAFTILVSLVVYQIYILTRRGSFCEDSIVSSDLSLTPKAGINMHTTSLATSDSLGFFNDIPDEIWKKQKEIALFRKHIHIPKTHLYPEKDYYQENWDPDFSCAAEDKLGNMGDGHKWICDPWRIAKQESCLVYSIGSNGLFDFEQAIQDVVGNCEIHIFDFDNYSHKLPKGLNVTLHRWGLKPVHDVNIPVTQSSRMVARSTFWRSKPQLDWKTLPEIVELLGHGGRVIDIFKIDCEGCEWYTFPDWFNTSAEIRQIAVEVHEAPNHVNDFFSHIHSQNYVMFHKEPNIQWSNGNCIEFSFLKLNGSFFEAPAVL